MACLSAVVLCAACAALYWSLQRNLAHEAEKAGEDRARTIAENVLGQWDEDLLVEVGQKGALFSEISLSDPDWAIVRPNGKIERAVGVFAGILEPLPLHPSRIVRLDRARTVRTFSVPLVEPQGLTLDGLPAVVRDAVLRSVPGGQLLKVKRELRGEESYYEMRFLEAHATLDLNVADDGRVLGRQKETLPTSLQEDLARELCRGAAARGVELLRWQAYGGQLLAIVRIHGRDGEASEFGVNRVGEHFELDPTGEVSSKLEPWKLHVTVAVDATHEVQAKTSLLLILGAGAAATWVLMTLGQWYVARRAMAPVQVIIDKVRSIELTRPGDRLPMKDGKDELSRIAATINGMLDRLEAAFTREREFTGDAAHELRTPISKVLAEIDLALLQPRSAEEYRGAIERCRGYAAGMQRLVESLLILARLDEQTRQVQWMPFDVGDLALETLGGFGSDEAKRIQLDLGDAAAPLLAVGERSLIGILIHNLLENALRYSLPETPVKLGLKRSDGTIEVRVEDQGPGIPEDQTSLVFNRFYRLETSRSRETGGVGLGLSIVNAIGLAHSTRVELGAGRDGGTVAVFKLPVANGAKRSLS
jgi:signal transduction histidine kinase